MVSCLDCYYPTGVLFFYLLQITSKLVRSTLQVGFVCQTVAKRPVTPGEESQLTREDVNCHIIYTANGKDRPPMLLLLF